MPSLMEYIDMKGSIPACLAMSFAAYIAFYTNDIQELTDRGLVCRRAKGNAAAEISANRFRPFSAPNKCAPIFVFLLFFHLRSHTIVVTNSPLSAAARGSSANRRLPL